MRFFRRAAGDGPGPLLRAGCRADRRVDGRREVLAACDALLRGADPRHVVVLGGPDPWTTRFASTTGRAYPEADVLVLRVAPDGAAPTEPLEGRVEVRSCRSVQRAHAELLARPAPELFVDAGGCPTALRRAVLVHLAAAVADDGLYVLLDGGEASDPVLQDAEGETLPQLLARIAAIDPSRPGPEEPDDRELARTLGERTTAGPVVALRRRGRRLAKVREEEVEAVLPSRLGPGRTRVLAARPATTFVSRAVRDSNAPDLDGRFRATFEVPVRTLRVVQDVVCLPRQAAVADDVLLPASFHHPSKARLHNRGTVDASRWYARHRRDPAEVVDLPGTWYHLASEFPGHFGHVMTEDLARLWGIDEARRAFGDVGLLYGAGDGEPPAFWRQLVEAYGIGDAPVLAPTTPVRVERLVTATPQLHNGRYVDPDLAETWARVCDGLGVRAADGPRRIFVTRPPGLQRRCLNGPELEARFVEAGFVVVSPESMGIAEQLALFAGADTVAGYAGSGLFSAIATAPGSTMVVVASESYTAANEWLISSVKGFRHHQLWCRSTRERSRGAFDGRAFHADFTVDLDRDGDALDRALHASAPSRTA